MFETSATALCGTTGIKIVWNLYQNRVKTIAVSYQNHQNPREIDQKAAPGCFCFVS